MNSDGFLEYVKVEITYYHESKTTKSSETSCAIELRDWWLIDMITLSRLFFLFNLDHIICKYSNMWLLTQTFRSLSETCSFN